MTLRKSLELLTVRAVVGLVLSNWVYLLRTSLALVR